MKAVILAGGYGTRLSEETAVRPKPMVEIGGRPILWHIMKIYAAHGVTEFIICCGYRGWMIKEYFADYALLSSDVTFDLARGSMEIHHHRAEPWSVTLIDTGIETMTGGRVKRARPYLDGETFFLTYGDGVADINVTDLLGYHRRQGTLATLTAVQPPGRFGALVLEEGQKLISSFTEKPRGEGESAWINGGYFVLEPAALDYIADDDTIWEREPLERLAKDRHLSAYRHEGFWQPMDTLRDKKVLEGLWDSGGAPWKIW